MPRRRLHERIRKFLASALNHPKPFSTKTSNTHNGGQDTSIRFSSLVLPSNIHPTPPRSAKPPIASSETLRHSLPACIIKSCQQCHERKQAAHPGETRSVSSSISSITSSD